MGHDEPGSTTSNSSHSRATQPHRSSLGRGDDDSSSFSSHDSRSRHRQPQGGGGSTNPFDPGFQAHSGGGHEHQGHRSRSSFSSGAGSRNEHGRGSGSMRNSGERGARTRGSASRGGGGGAGGFGDFETLSALEQSETPMTADEMAQLRIQRAQKSADDSLDRSLGRLDATVQTGAETGVQLREQRDQINRIRDRLEDTHEVMDRSQYILNGMKSWGGAFVNMFRKPPPARAAPDRPEPEYLPEPHDRNHRSASQQPRPSSHHRPQQQRQTQRYSEDSAEARQDEKLDMIHSRLKTLGNMATDMNAELRLHNKLLTDVEGKVDTLDDRLVDQTRQMRRL